MNDHVNVLENFEEIINSIKRIEKNAEVFRELKEISTELSQLKEYVKENVDNFFKGFQQFNTDLTQYSKLIDFHQQVVNCSKWEEARIRIFDFISQQINYDLAFILVKLTEENQEYSILLRPEEEKARIQKFIRNSDLANLKAYLKKRNSAINNLDLENPEKLNWKTLGLSKAILFPLTVQGKNIGTGFILRREIDFQPHEVAFVNLILGLISLIVYQSKYYDVLKEKLTKQAASKKIEVDSSFKNYIDNGPLSLFVLDSNKIILQTNKAAISTWQRNDNPLGENFLEIVPEAFRNGLARIIDESRDNQIDNYISPLMKDGDSKIIAEFFISSYELTGQKDLRLILVLDISSRFYREQIEHRNEILDELDQFSRILVGQLINLLTTIIPNIALLRNRLKSDLPSRQYLDVIDRAARRSSNLIHKFLNYDLEDLENLEEINVNKLLRAHITALQEDIPERIKIKLNLDPQIKSFPLYPLKMVKIFDILLSNSLTALQNRENSELEFSTRILQQKENGLIGSTNFYLKKGSYLELCVRDNGIGIPSKSLMQVLKPFYSTRVKNEGVGLELFIAYNIVKEMKGQIFIDSEIDKYTAVYIYLPFKEEDKMRTATYEKIDHKRELVVQRPTILVVDDEYNIRSMMREIMEMSGLKVFTAGNGKDGVEMYKKYRDDIDLIIMDMVMPIMDGREAFLEIKKIDPQQKIFIISGYSQREDLEDMLEKGAVGFLRKPFQVKEIVSKVKEILGSTN